MHHEHYRVPPEGHPRDECRELGIGAWVRHANPKLRSAYPDGYVARMPGPTEPPHVLVQPHGRPAGTDQYRLPPIDLTLANPTDILTSAYLSAALRRLAHVVRTEHPVRDDPSQQPAPDSATLKAI
ncbi:hypothetical protein OG948_14360 [Embleya sp. NBC_00888]|uniref:hypothetical protein n=1 Tax=Embleya sp. NBC_00888 TaxID=2975960 RepID=UPI00387007EC|nr:hypothetical protein OG948_14360 [Embleya sp. NBC_00888]